MEGHAQLVAVARPRPLVPAPLYVVTGAISVQAGSALAFTAFHRVGILGIVWGRILFGGLFLAAWARLGRAGTVRAGAVRRPASETWRLAVAFGLTLAIMNTFFYEALARLPLGPAVTIEFVGPVVVAVATSRRRLDLVWVALAAVGVAMLSAGYGGTQLTGLVLILLAGAAWASYIVLGRRVAAVWPGVSGVGAGLLVGSIALAPVAIVADGGRLVHSGAILDCAILGLLASAIPYGLEQYAMRRLPASTFAVVLSLHPAVAAVVGAVALDQGLGWRQALAIALVIIASAGALRSAAGRGAVSPTADVATGQ